MFVCGRQRKKPATRLSNEELSILEKNTRFSNEEIKNIRDRFFRISNASKKITKKQFRENMGLLGLETVFFISDRIFDMLDSDKDSEVSFEEFISYLDVMVNGSQEEKYKISYRLIDFENKGFFGIEEFSFMISSMVSVWCGLTGTQISSDMTRKLEYYNKHIFNEMDSQGKGMVTFEDYVKAMERDPNSLDIFDFLNNSFNTNLFAQSTDSHSHEMKELVIDIQNLEKNLEKLARYLSKNKKEHKKKESLPKLPTSLFPEKIKYLFENDSIHPNSKNLERGSIKHEEEGKIWIPLPCEENKHFFEGDKINTSSLSCDFHNRNFFSPENKSAKTLRKIDQKVKNLFKLANREASEGASPINIVNSLILKNKSGVLPKNHRGENYFDLSENNKKNIKHRSSLFSPLKLNNPWESKSFCDFPNNIDEEIMSHKINTPKVFSESSRFMFKKEAEFKYQLLKAKDPNKKLKKTYNEELQKNKKKQKKKDSLNNTKIKPVFNKLEKKLLSDSDASFDMLLIPKEEGNCTFSSRNEYSEIIFDKEEEKHGEEEKFELSEVSSQNDGKKELEPNFIEELHFQTKNLREQIEKNFKENKSLVRRNSFTLLNVHKPVKIKKSLLKESSTKDKLVFLGHENWNLVLNMMLGIQMAVKSLVASKDYIITPRDFKLKYYFELIPRRIKSNNEITKICKFYDYAPYVFHEIRKQYNINADDYLKSIGPENMLSNLIKGNLNTLTELVSCGKSGSFFYYSVDGRFTLKTIHKHEFHFLKDILKNYYEHIKNNPDSLIIKFFGLHKLRFRLNNSIRQKKLYIIIMSNVFHTSKEIHERYDLKGSTYKRKESKGTFVKKDLDALENKLQIKITAEKANEFLNTLKKDCEFFEKNKIIDYSLLIGIHHKSKNEENNISMKRNEELDDSGMFNLSINDEFNILQEKTLENKMISSDNSCIYYIGIIDILTSFNTKKKLEYVFKAISIGKTISAIPPLPYSDRFQNFIKRIIQISI